MDYNNHIDFIPSPEGAKRSVEKAKRWDDMRKAAGTYEDPATSKPRRVVARLPGGKDWVSGEDNARIAQRANEQREAAESRPSNIRAHFDQLKVRAKEMLADTKLKLTPEDKAKLEAMVKTEFPASMQAWEELQMKKRMIRLERPAE